MPTAQSARIEGIAEYEIQVVDRDRELAVDVPGLLIHADRLQSVGGAPEALANSQVLICVAELTEENLDP